MTSSWKGKRVLIMGLGLHGGGVGSARFFAERGAVVTATDLRSKEDLMSSLNALHSLDITYTLGRHNEADFMNTDLVIQNPGVPSSSRYLRIARENGITIETDMTIFANLVKRSNVIGVTGTKGKSTTASLIAHLLLSLGKRVELAGNIRRSVLDLVETLTENTAVVLELSSWQLEELNKKQWSPHIAVITSLFEDHLNRYASFEDYIDAKRSIVRHQTAGDTAVLPANDALAQSFAKETPAHILSVRADNALQSVLRLPGRHNILNASLARAATEAFLKTTLENSNIRQALQSFQGLEGRLERVREKNGICYINDTTATTPRATVEALRSFPETPIALIAGGDDKKLPYEQLSEEIKRSSMIKKIILLPGSATDILKTMLREIIIPMETISTMKEAVTRARLTLEKSGGVVLLSPAATSFAQWHNEFERGNAFRRAAITP